MLADIPLLYLMKVSLETDTFTDERLFTCVYKDTGFLSPSVMYEITHSNLEALQEKVTEYFLLQT